jgi:hypothetical protein
MEFFFQQIPKRLFMSDNSKLRDGRDRSKVSGSESHELSYLQEKLGVSRAQVEEAIKEVGNSREKVEAYLKRGR